MALDKQNNSVSVARLANQVAVEARVRAALAHMLAGGERISFYSVSARANVARSTLYRNEKLKNLVEHARSEAQLQNQASPSPAQLQVYIAKLETELQQVKKECTRLRNKISSGRFEEQVNYYLIPFEDIAA